MRFFTLVVFAVVVAMATVEAKPAPCLFPSILAQLLNLPTTTTTTAAPPTLPPAIQDIIAQILALLAGNWCDFTFRYWFLKYFEKILNFQLKFDEF